MKRTFPLFLCLFVCLIVFKTPISTIISVISWRKIFVVYLERFLYITNSFFLATTYTQKKYPFCKYDLCGNCNTSIDLKIIHTVKGDTFYFEYDIYKLLTCRSDGIAWFLFVMMYIQCLFLTIYDFSDPIGNLW